MENPIGKAAAAVAGTAIAGLALLVVPTAAQAATSTCGAVPYVYFGTLCANIDSNPGYRAVLRTSDGGGGNPVDWNLICDNNRWFGSEGSFTTVANRQHSYVFKVGNQGKCKVRLYHLRNGDFFDTAYITP